MRVVVSGARSGLGASVVAALLASHFARAGPTVLVEASGTDSLDLVLGLEHVPGIRWPALGSGETTTADPVWTLPRWSGVEVLSGSSATALATDVGRDVLAALAARDVVVIDAGTEMTCGPGHGPDATGGSAGESRADDTRHVTVVGTDVVSVSKARATGRTLLVVRQVRHAALSPFEVADALDCPVVAVIHDDGLLARSVEAGFGPVPGRATRRAISRLARALDPTRSREDAASVGVETAKRLGSRRWVPGWANDE